MNRNNLGGLEDSRDGEGVAFVEGPKKGPHVEEGSGGVRRRTRLVGVRKDVPRVDKLFGYANIEVDCLTVDGHANFHEVACLARGGQTFHLFIECYFQRQTFHFFSLVNNL